MGLLAPPRSFNTLQSKFKYFLAVTFVALVASFVFSPASASAADTYRWANQDTITATVAPLGQQSDLFLYGPERGSTISFTRPLGPYTGDGDRRYIGTVTRGNCEGNLILTVSAGSKGSGTIRTDPTSCLLGGGSLGQLGKTITIGNVAAATKTANDIRQECASQQLPYNEATGTCGGRTNPNPDDDTDAAADEEDATEETLETLLCGGIDSSMRWIACPLTTLLTEILQGVEEALHALLKTDTSLFDNQGYQGAWSAFRTIALALIVIAGLVIVIGQAAGIQVLDAYTIKKAVPRLVLAVLFISLSWPLLELIVTINDNIARLLEGIIISPFNGVDSQYGGGESVASGVGNWLALGGIVAMLTPIIAGSTILAGAWGILGSFLLIGAAGVLIAFLVIGLRAVLITICIIMAPFAIACAILPATAKVFELWRKTLISCLLIYPLIILLLTAGKVGALMSSDGTLSLLLYLVPYFAIPFAFTMVGGVIGKLAGIANNANAGLFDRQRKKREELRGQMGAAFKSGSGFKTNSRFGAVRGLGAAVNTAGTATGLGMRNRFGIGQGLGAEAVSQRDMANAQEIMKSTEFSTISENDNALHALHGIGSGRSRDQVIKTLESRGVSNEDATRAYNTAKSTHLEGRSASLAAAQQLVLTGTGYNNYEDMVATLGEAAGGNRTTAESLGGFANALTKQKGRHDLAPGGGRAAADVMQATLGKGVATTNITTSAAPDGTTQVDEDAFKRLKASFDSGSVYQLANGKGTAIKTTFAPGFQKVMEAELGNFAKTGVASDKLKQTFIVRQELQAALPNASGDNRDAINSALETMNNLEAATRSRLGGDSSPAAASLDRLRKEASTAARAYERPDPNMLQD